jgi:hypothetical protein
MSRAFPFFFLSASLLAAGGGCGLDEEGIAPPGSLGPEGGDAFVPDVRGRDAPGMDSHEPDGATRDATKDGARDASRDAAKDASSDSFKDAGTETSTTCPPTPDCANPACKALGYVCTPKAPSGWSIAAVDFTSSVACPPGYGTSYTVVTAPTGGPASCGCPCSLSSSPSCVSGAIDFSFNAYYGDKSCDTADSLDANDGACTTAVVAFSTLTEVTGLPGPTGGTCTGTATMSLPSTGSTPAYVCPLSAPSGTGCSSSEECVAVGSTESQCVIESGANACSGAYSVAYAVGSSVTDTRGCTGACTCGPPTATCGDRSWTFYSNGNCTGAATSIDLDGSCDPTGPSFGTVDYSYQYTATPMGTACGTATATPTPSGSLGLVAPQTLCCLP